MKYKQIHIVIFLTTFISTGCQDSLLDMVSPHPSQVSFSISLLTEYPQTEILTKGTPQTGLSVYANRKIQVLGIDGTSAPNSSRHVLSKLYKTGDYWQLDPQRWYDELEFEFYAFASDLDSITTDRMNQNGLQIDKYAADGKIRYKVPTNVILQPDLIVADKTDRKSKGMVDLKMFHALSCVGFVATSQHQGRKIHSFTVKRIYGEGEMRIAKQAEQPLVWTTLGDTAGIRFTADTNLQELSTTRPSDLTQYMNANGYLMMVPQTLPEGAQIEIALWDGTHENSISTLYYDIPPTTWEPGKKYIYYFDEPILKGVSTYYECYSNGESGFYYYDNQYANDSERLTNSIKLDRDLQAGNLEIVDAGYGLLTPASVFTKYPSIYLGLDDLSSPNKVESISKGNVVARLTAFTGLMLDCVLYPVSQNLYPYNRNKMFRDGLQPYFGENKPRRIEAGVSTAGSGKPIHTVGYILSNYAKGVYRTNENPINHFIRTPIQMRNISYQATHTGVGSTVKNKYIQELETLNFSYESKKKTLGNDVSGFFQESIIIGQFGGTYDGSTTRGTPARLAGLLLKINDVGIEDVGIGLFESVFIEGKVSNLEMLSNCIFINSGDNKYVYLAAFCGINNGVLLNLTNRASITNHSSNTHVGGIVGQNACLVKGCVNSGAIVNRSNRESNKTGGIVAWNAKGYTWAELAPDVQTKFKKMQIQDYDGDEEFPSALTLNCKNLAKITGVSYIGGIAGYNNFGGILWRCTNAGEVTNNELIASPLYMGGIVGLQQCGENNNSSMNPPAYFTLTQECANTGRVTLRSGQLGDLLGVGGIVGNNDFAAGLGQNEPFAYAKVNRCVVQRTTISGRFSDTGGIAGFSSGSVNRSVCDHVYITGVFGDADPLKEERNSAGGIVGCNMNYVGDCLYIHTSGSSPISDADTSGPFWSGSSVSGGIVGINNTFAAELKSNSALVKKCIYAAVAPKNVRAVTEVGHFAPIAGYSGGYLYRSWNGASHMKDDGVDGTTGATPLYTLDDNYFVSGKGQNEISDTRFFNAPSAETEIYGPFTNGRYPYGTIPLSKNDLFLLPFQEWGVSSNTQRWSFLKRPPYPLDLLAGYNSFNYTLPDAEGTAYLLSGLVTAVSSVSSVSSVSAEINYEAPASMKIANSLRITLNYIPEEMLRNKDKITLDLTRISLESNQAGGSGQIFVRAPLNWKFSQSNPKSYLNKVTDSQGKEIGKYWYCLVTKETGRVVTMVPL